MAFLFLSFIVRNVTLLGETPSASQIYFLLREGVLSLHQSSAISKVVYGKRNKWSRNKADNSIFFEFMKKQPYFDASSASTESDADILLMRILESVSNRHTRLAISFVVEDVRKVSTPLKASSSSHHHHHHHHHHHQHQRVALLEQVQKIMQNIYTFCIWLKRAK